jgi:hypothetical protein
MLKPSFKNILLYILLKYLLFYVFMMFKNNDFRILHFYNLKNGEDWFYYLWLVLFVPVLNMILFWAPIYFIFKTKKAIYFVLLMSVILVAEYFLYTYLVSQLDLMNGVYNGIISLLVLLLFFFKQIVLIFKQKSIAA